MKKKHLVILYPHVGLLKNFIRLKEISSSEIVIYSSASNFIRILQSQDVFDSLHSCRARVQIELPLLNIECQLSRKMIGFLRRMIVRTPIFFQEICVLLASAITPKLNLAALNLDYYDELTVDASLETSFLSQYKGTKTTARQFVVHVLSHSHKYPDSVVIKKKRSLIEQDSSLGIKRPVIAVSAVKSESLLPYRISHVQCAVDMPYLVIFQRSPDQYVSKDFMFSVFREILEWGCRNNVNVLIKPHIWPNRRFLIWYFHWRFIRGLPGELTYLEPEALIDGCIGAVCFYSSILEEISSRGRPGLQAVSDRALPRRLVGPSSVEKAFTVQEVIEFLRRLPGF